MSQFKYNNGQLREQATMEKPVFPDLRDYRDLNDDLYFLARQDYENETYQYNVHIASLRCYQTEGSGWVENKLYEETDFTVKNCDCVLLNDCPHREKDSPLPNPCMVAVLTKETAQEDLWNEVFNLCFATEDFCRADIAGIVNDLKTNFNLTRKP